jgi:hypothetical protein
MQVDIENTFKNIFQATIFKELCGAKWLLANIIPFTKLFHGAHSFFYYQHG